MLSFLVFTENVCVMASTRDKATLIRVCNVINSTRSCADVVGST